MDKVRHEYVLPLPAPLTLVRTQHPTGGALRHPAPEETELLAEVMLDAYANTVDDDGETTDDALVEVEGFFGGRTGAPLLDCSWVYDASGTLLCASLVTLHEGAPLISYVMTRAAWKERGLAAWVLRQSLLSLQDARYSEVRAWITQGNTPSERLFTSFGFQSADS